MRAAAAALIAACGLLLGAATAQSARSERIEAKLKAANTDGDDLISRAEAQRALPKQSQRFDEIDVNRDGYLTRDEIAALRAKRQEKKATGKP